MHGSMRRGLETEHPVMVTAVKRPAGETRGKVAAGPDAGQRHRASPRPYSLLALLPPGGDAVEIGETRPYTEN